MQSNCNFFTALLTDCLPGNRKIYWLFVLEPGEGDLVLEALVDGAIERDEGGIGSRLVSTLLNFSPCQ
jgi:hypothetical protein